MTRKTALGLFGISAMIFGVSFQSQAATVSGQGTWETTLEARSLDGVLTTIEAYYDSVLDITWLVQADSRGGVTNWADTMAATTGVLGEEAYGINHWRLPTMLDTSTPGCNFANTGTDCGYNVQTGSASTTVYSELASMFYDTLGNLSLHDASGSSPQTGWGLSNTGPFSGLQADGYWIGVEDASYTTDAWLLDFNSGTQHPEDKDQNFYYTWLVHDGDVGASVVPVPAAVWLFGSGLVGLIGIARRKKA